MRVSCVLNSIMIKFVSWKWFDILNHLQSTQYNIHLPSYCMKNICPQTNSKISETKRPLSTNFPLAKNLVPKKLGILFEKKQQFQYIVIIIIIIIIILIIITIITSSSSSSIRHVLQTHPISKNKLQPKVASEDPIQVMHKQPATVIQLSLPLKCRPFPASHQTRCWETWNKNRFKRGDTLPSPWEPKTFIFRGYNPYIGGLKPSFFMVLGSKSN